MSKKRKKKLTPQRIIKAGLILLVIVGALFVTKEIIVHRIENEEEKLPETFQEDNKTGKEEKKEDKKTEDNANKPEETEEKTPTQGFDGEDPNIKNELTGIITTARVSEENLIIRVEIDQFLTSGTCKLVLSKGENTYSEDANIFADASTSTCEGFNIPVSKLEDGNWKIRIELSSNSKTGQIEGG